MKLRNALELAHTMVIDDITLRIISYNTESQELYTQCEENGEDYYFSAKELELQDISLYSLELMDVK